MTDWKVSTMESSEQPQGREQSQLQRWVGRQWAGMSIWQRVFAVVATAVVVGASMFAYVSSSAERGATKECKQAVEDRLKAPSTAEFGEAFAEVVDDPLKRAPAGELWEVSGPVDSENSFGASVRNYYTCRTTHENDFWQVLSVNFSGEGADGLG